MSRKPYISIRVISSLILGASFLSACGIKGELKRPEPIFDKSANITAPNQ